MELLEGESLGARLTRVGRLSVPESIDVCRQALRSIAEAHAKGIVHRDLKPDNLFFSNVAGGGKGEEILKVLDFGIAKLVGETNEVMNAVETQAGTVFGTPRYMSPEQAQGKPLDARSDLYSMGVILYHVLTGRPPFTDDDAVVVMARHIKTVPPPMAEACPEAGVPPEVEALVLRLLAKEPAMRPKTAEALAVELTHLIDSGIASTSGVRFSISRSVPPPRPDGPMLDGASAPAPSSETLALVGLARSGARRRSWKWGIVGLTSCLVVIMLMVAFHSDDTPSSSSPSSAGSAGSAGSPGSPVGQGGSPATTPHPANDIPLPPDEPAIPTLSADQLPRVSSVPHAPPAPPEGSKGGWHRARGPNNGRGSTPGPAAGGSTAPTPSSAASTGYGYLE